LAVGCLAVGAAQVKQNRALKSHDNQSSFIMVAMMLAGVDPLSLL
jgi:hypothetical protein